MAKSDDWRRLLPRFSLRTGVLLFLFLGTALGLVARWIGEIRDRGEAQRALVANRDSSSARRNPVEATYESEQGASWSTELIRHWVHPEYNRRFQGLLLDGRQLSDEASVRIARVFGVENIIIHSNIPTDKLVRISQAPGLKRLYFYGEVTKAKSRFEPQSLRPPQDLASIEFGSPEPIEEGLVRWLRAAPQLKKIWVHRVPQIDYEPHNLVEFAKTPGLVEFSVYCNQTSPESPSPRPPDARWNSLLARTMNELTQRPKLKRLRLFAAELGDPSALRHFCETSEIRYLHLEGCAITPDCLKEIAKLKKIETLHLHWSPMTTEHLKILATMKTLRGIHALRTSDANAFRELERALPKCKITRYLQ